MKQSFAEAFDPFRSAESRSESGRSPKARAMRMVGIGVLLLGLGACGESSEGATDAAVVVDASAAANVDSGAETDASVAETDASVADASPADAGPADPGPPPPEASDDEHCGYAASHADYLDQFQDINDSSVLFCHFVEQGTYSFVNSSFNACLTHFNNHRSEETVGGQVVQTGDVFPTLGCGA